MHLENVARQVLSVVNASVHDDEFFKCRFLFDTRIMKARVQDDDGERQDVTSV